MNSDDQKGSKPSYPIIFSLSIFLGIFGGHRFYLGRIKSGILQLLTFGGLGLWTFIDVIMILLGVFKDKSGNPIPNPKPKVYWSVFALIGFFVLMSPESPSNIQGGSQTVNTTSQIGRDLSRKEQHYAGAYQGGAWGLVLGATGSFVMTAPGADFSGEWTMHGTTISINPRNAGRMTLRVLPDNRLLYNDGTIAQFFTKTLDF